MSEAIPLEGGRTTAGVVRIGDTVRRATNPNSPFVHELLEHLEHAGFDAAPRFLGLDEEGREILSFHEGRVPPELQPDHDDNVLRAAAALIRRYHDAVAGSPLAGDAEVVCHNDLSPVNCVFDQRGLPAVLIDFDIAAPGARLRDLAYALFLWLELCDDGPSLQEQARRTRVFFDAYGNGVPTGLVDAILAIQRETAGRRMAGDDSEGAVRWWRGQADWLEQSRAEYEEALG
jgi:serine/threonine protein kinase